MPREYVTILVDKIIRESESGLAWQCLIDTELVWLPRSQLAAPEEWVVGLEGESFEIPKWIADEKELEY